MLDKIEEKKISLVCRGLTALPHPGMAPVPKDELSGARENTEDHFEPIGNFQALTWGQNLWNVPAPPV